MSIIEHVAPDCLIMIDGELLLRNGGDPQEYLKKWQRDAKIPNGTAVNVILREGLLEYCIISLAEQNRQLQTNSKGKTK